MIPSCSRYGLAQFQTQPALTAFLNTSDRLMRCGHDHRRYGLYARGAAVKLIDTGSARGDAELRFRFARPYFAFADTSDASATLRFIQHLMNQHYYDQALLEISRALYTKQTPGSKPLYINYIRCLKAKGDYEKITYEYEVSFPPELRTDPDVRLEMAQVWMQLENYANARSMLQLPPGAPAPSMFSDRAALRCFSFMSFRMRGTGEVVLNAGTAIALETVSPIRSESVLAGQMIDFRVRTDVKIGDQVVIRGGTMAKGQVMRAEKAKGIGKEGLVEVQIKSVPAVDGQEILLTGGNVYQEGEDKQTLSIVLGVLVCLLFLTMKGKNAEVPAGYAVSASTATLTKVAVN